MARINRQATAHTQFGLGQIQLHVILEMLRRSLQGLQCRRVTFKRRQLGRERRTTPQPIGNIGQVTQRAGIVTFQNVGVEIRLLAAADGGDEVAEVCAIPSTVAGAAGRRQLRERSGLVAVLRIVGRAGDDPRFQMIDVADPLRAEGLRRAAARLKNQLRLTKVEHGDLRIGRLTLILISKPPADAQHALGQRGSRNGPACQIHFVNTLVTNIPVAEIPEPMPVIGHQVLVERLLGCRARPQVEIQHRGGRLGRLHPDTIAILVAQAARDQQFAQLARLDDFHHVGLVRIAAILRAVLHDAVVFASSLHSHAPFVHVVTAGLFDVHVFAGLARPDGHQRVPVIGGRDRHGIDILIVQRLANVGDLLRCDAALLFDRLRPRCKSALIGIDQIGDLHTLALHARISPDVRRPAAIQTGDGNANRFIGPENIAGRFRAANGKRRSSQQCRLLHKFAAIQTSTRSRRHRRTLRNKIGSDIRHNRPLCRTQPRHATINRS